MPAGIEKLPTKTAKVFSPAFAVDRSRVILIFSAPVASIALACPDTTTSIDWELTDPIFKPGGVFVKSIGIVNGLVVAICDITIVAETVLVLSDLTPFGIFRVTVVLIV